MRIITRLLSGLPSGAMTTVAYAQEPESVAKSPTVAGSEPLSTLMICTLAAAIVVVIAGYFVMQARDSRAQARDSRAADNRQKDPPDPPIR